MTILIKIDDFLFELFPETNQDIAQIKEKLIEFYTVDNVKPQVILESDVIKVNVANNSFSGDNPVYQKLISEFEKGNLIEAKELAKELISKNPTNSEFHRLLGQVYSDLGENEEGINSLIDALRWNPNNEYALVMIGNIYARHYKDIETALKYYEQVVKLKPNDHIAINNIGANFLQQGRSNEAINYFEKALNINDEYPYSYLGLSYAYVKKNQFPKAFDYIIKGLKKYTKKDEVWKTLMGQAFKISETFSESEIPDELVQIYKLKIEKAGNRIILIEEDESIPTAAKIEYAENYDRKEDVIKFNPKFSAYQHLILHELVHLELTLEARENNHNKLFVSNAGHKDAFKSFIPNCLKQLEKKNFPQSSIDKVVDDLFHGLNSQIFNSAPDLFIENRLHNKVSDIRPIQFTSLHNMIQQGIQAVTNKDIVELTGPWVVSTSKVLNLLNAIQFKELFGVDLLDKFNVNQSELDQAKTLYDEFLEYRDDKKPGEEFELIQNWANDLQLDKYFQIVNENEYRKKDSIKGNYADDILGNIIKDPYDLESDNDAEMQTFLDNQEKLGLNKAVIMYMVEALNYFENIEQSKIKDIAQEIAMQGAQGYNPELKYKLNKIPNKTFTGYQILAFYYVSWAISIPEMLDKLQLPFDKEYEVALELKK